ncbi:MAG: hypothetical protein H6842_15070 [Rhodospirillaceae bacterium]|nr:hypothetical protein [Rhodospirillaceae bacterium]
MSRWIIAFLYAMSMAVAGAAHTASLPSRSGLVANAVPDWVRLSICRAYPSGGAQQQADTAPVGDAHLLTGGPDLVPVLGQAPCPDTGLRARPVPAAVAGLVPPRLARGSNARDPPSGRTV